MNRIIKFRGKRIDNGEWVVGNYLQRHDSFGALALIEVQDEEDYEINTYQVYPESVGQFTGFTDTNGRLVFEGDITDDKRMVKWEKGSFWLKQIGGIGNFPMSFFAEEKLDTEIIDNIHDAPVNLLNPAKGAVTYSMSTYDPNAKAEETQQEATQEQATDQTQTEPASEAEKGEE